MYDSKEAVELDSLDINKIVVSNKWKINDTSSKFFVGYLNDSNVIGPLFIILPQISGYIKYFKEGSKNMSFKTDDEDIYSKYSKNWDKIKELLNTNLHSQRIHKK